MYHYKTKKKKKLATIEKTGKDFILSIVLFDQDTGKKKEPTRIRLYKEILEEQKAGHEAEVADIDALLADVKLLI